MSRVVNRLALGALALSIGVIAMTARISADEAKPATLVRAPAPPRHAAKSEAAAKARAQISYAKLPLTFEPNRGQTDPRVKFLSRGQSATLYLTSTDATLVLSRSSRPDMRAPMTFASAKAILNSVRTVKVERRVIRTRFIGANPEAQIEGVERLTGASNYFIGGDQSKWRTNIPNYAKVRYRSLFPGIDLVYYGTQGHLEFDVIAAPGADPNRFRLAVDGGDKTEINSAGDLVIHAGADQIVFHRPIAYQEVAQGRRSVAAAFKLRRGNKIAFKIASYDRHFPLIIDPVLVYSTYLGGGGGNEGASSIAVDSSGNAYVTGLTGSPDFPTTSGSFQTTISGAVNPMNGGYPSNAFVTKLDPSASGVNSLIYSTYIGEALQSLGIAVDSLGSAYITGETAGNANFPLMNAFSTNAGNGGTAFVTKLNPGGNALLYSTFFGGYWGSGIAVDSSDKAYITGLAYTGLPTLNAFQSTCPAAARGSEGAFVAKFDPSASGAASLLYSTYLCGSGDILGDGDLGVGIAVDTAGNAYVAGSTSSSDFPTLNAFQSVYPSSNPGGSAAFVAKLNPAASGAASLLYSTYLGGSAIDNTQGAIGIAVDSVGNAYVTGTTSSTDFPTLHAFQGTFAGGESDAFVAKLNPSASGAASLLYSTYLGGSNRDFGGGIAVDSAGDAYGTGFTQSSDFPISNAFQCNCASSEPPFGNCGANAFVVKINPAASGAASLVYSSYLGNSTGALGAGIATDSSGNAYVTGRTGAVGFPTVNAFQETFGGGNSVAFVTKVSPVITHDTTPPTITISSPAATTYDLNEPVVAAYTCSDPYDSLGLCAGPVATGADIDTTSVGRKTFTVDAKDCHNNLSTQSVSYTVVLPPAMIVNTTSDESSPGDGLCSLREAINNANSPGVDTTAGDCTLGSGNDIINFSVSGTIVLGRPLPVIQNSVTIDGSGRTIAIDGANSFTALIVNSGATLNLDDLTIQHAASSIVSNGVSFGGGIFSFGTTTVANSTFSGNSAGDGGGIFAEGSLSVTESTFSGNSAGLFGGGFGGAIFNFGTATIANSTFAGNSATIGGGGVFNNVTNATVTSSTFSGNSADSYGGGIFNDGTITVSNSTFVGNDAGLFGGGIFDYNTNAIVTSSTFSANSAGSAGGGIFNDGTTAVSQAILSKNTGGDCAGNALNNGGYNIDDDGSCLFGRSTGARGQTIGDQVSPLLDARGLQNNGGPTETIGLQSASPAIDAIPQGNTNCPGVDQRGFNRPAPGHTACDVGAYEFGAVACTATYTGNFNGNVNISSGLVCIINGTVTGNVTQNGGGLFTSNATIGGNLQITGGGTFSMASTDINGDLQIQNIPAGSAQNQICGTHVKGNLTFHNNGVAIAIGTTSASCPGDTIGNDLQVNNNTAAVQVFDDSVGGNLQCGNNSTIAGGGDTAKSLQGQCASF
jgi:CSLREA domain-containing protein